MKENVKYIILGICIIIVVVLCIVLRIKHNVETVNIVPENIITNTVNEIENTVTNEIANEVSNEVTNEVTNEISNNTQTNAVVSTEYEKQDDEGSTDKKQEAINLVKEKWGEDNTVTFRCDSITNDGEYIIAVILKDSARVKNYFRVNLAKKTVEVDY